jgi:parallel beta-helix repeat protein
MQIFKTGIECTHIKGSFCIQKNTMRKGNSTMKQLSIFSKKKRAVGAITIALLVSPLITVTGANAATLPVTGPSSTQGSAKLGTTNYAVPSTALVVAPTGSDTAAGTLASPLKTVQAAVTKAKAGQTVVVRAGEYNESINVPYSKPLTIQAYPKETVWFDGSQKVTTWTQNGTTWSTPWSFFPSSVIDGIADNPRYVHKDHPLASKRDQVFINGVQMTQVATAAEVKGNTFYVDTVAKKVIIGTSPVGKEVRISNLSAGIMVNSAGTTLQGFGVRRYASTSEDQAAVRMVNINATAQNLQIEDNAYLGLSMSNNNAKVDHVTILRSGMLGLGSNAAYGSSFTNSRIEQNNFQQFKQAPVAGGFKITRSRDVKIDNLYSSNNWGAGIWLDESVYNASITNSITNNNSSTGISLELSQKVIVANNSSSNQTDGLTIVGTGDVKVYNNEFENNSRFAVRVAQDSRLASDTKVPGHDPRQPLPDPTVSWATKDITIANNTFGATKGFQFYALNAAPKNITLTGNLFNVRAQTGQNTVVAWGVTPDSTGDFIRYDTPEALNKNINPTWKNAITKTVLPLSSMTADETNNVSVATPIPADIAKLINVPTNTKKIGNI